MQLSTLLCLLGLPNALGGYLPIDDKARHDVGYVLTPRDEMEPVSGDSDNITNEPGAITMPLYSLGSRGDTRHQLQKENLVFSGLVNDFLPTIAVGFGSPRAQTIYLMLDTDSWETWVNPLCSLSRDPHRCESMGVYWPQGSQTVIETGEPFFQASPAGVVGGYYYEDDIKLGTCELRSARFAKAEVSTGFIAGVLGIGFGYPSGNTKYKNIMDLLYTQQFTHSKLVSIGLGRQDAPEKEITGTVTFGGVNSRMYSGMLQKVPLVSTEAPKRYSVSLSGISIDRAVGNTSTPIDMDDGPITVMIDSASSHSLLPYNLIYDLVQTFPDYKSVPMPSGLTFFQIDCRHLDDMGWFKFNFQKSDNTTAAIRVPFSEFLVRHNEDSCTFGAVLTPGAENVGLNYLLGANFLRGAYVVFDQDSDALYMGDLVRCGTKEVSVGPAVDMALKVFGECEALPPTPDQGTSTNGTSPATLLTKLVTRR